MGMEDITEVITNTSEATATAMERDRLTNLPRRLIGELLSQMLRLRLRQGWDLAVSAVLAVSATEVLDMEVSVGSMVASEDMDTEDTDCTEEDCTAEVSMEDMVCGRSEEPNTSLY